MKPSDGSLGEIVHKLRTPLTSLKLYTELIEGNALRGKIPQKKWLRLVKREVDTLIKLTNQLAD